jgi:hypothetical protein
MVYTVDMIVYTVDMIVVALRTNVNRPAAVAVAVAVAGAELMEVTSLRKR